MKLIVEMEMPKDCPMCPLAHYNKIDEFTGCEVAPFKRYAVKTDKAYAESDCRPDWCPIKGVLPDEHGDLIDRDALLSVKDKYGKDVLCVSKNTIANMPVLIAAERKDDEQIH